MSALSAGSGPLMCRVTCEEGRYCSEDSCLPCPPGQFQKLPIHTETSCEGWTRKPPGEHWEIKRNGTPSSDIEWQCKEGFVEIKCGVECQECVIPTKTPTTSTSGSVNFSSVIQQNTTTMSIIEGPEKQVEQEGLSDGEIAGVCVAVIAAFIIIVLVICYLRKKKKPIPPVLKREEASEPLTYSGDPEAVDSPGPEKEKAVNSPGPEKKNLFPFFHQIVKQLGPDNTLKLLHHLPGVGHDWVTRTVGWEKEKNGNTEIYYSETFMRWTKENPSLDQEKEVLRKCEELGLHPSSSDQLKNIGPLSYYLLDKLGPEDATAFLGQFGATQTFKHKQEAGTSVQNAFVETLCEILKTGKDNATSLSKTLKEMNQNEIVESDEYKKLYTSLFVRVGEERKPTSPAPNGTGASTPPLGLVHPEAVDSPGPE